MISEVRSFPQYFPTLSNQHIQYDRHSPQVIFLPVAAAVGVANSCLLPVKPCNDNDAMFPGVVTVAVVVVVGPVQYVIAAESPKRGGEFVTGETI